MTEQQKKNAALIAATKKKAALFSRVFGSADGKAALEELQKELNPSILLGPSSEVTHYNLGKRDAYIYITDLIKFSEKNNETTS